MICVILFFFLPSGWSIYTDVSQLPKVITDRCKVFQNLQDVCIYYDFNKNCHPWNTHNCRVLDYTFNDPFCPQFFCKVRNFIFFTIFSNLYINFFKIKEVKPSLATTDPPHLTNQVQIYYGYSLFSLFSQIYVNFF